MQLIKDRIKNIYPIVDKKVTKPKTNSFTEMFDYFCKKEVRRGYKVKKNSTTWTLLRPTEEVKERLDIELKSLREKYVKLKALQDSTARYDEKLDNDIIECSKNIKRTLTEITDLEYDFTTVRKILDVKDYKKILEIFNVYACEEIINGKALMLNYRLGYIEARVVERNHKKKSIDMNATMKRKRKLLDDGVLESDLYHSTKNPTGSVKYTIFRTDEDWCRIAWSKGHTRNISVYGFKPAENRKELNGFKNNFSRAIKENPQLKLKYPKILQKDMKKKKE